MPNLEFGSNVACAGLGTVAQQQFFQDEKFLKFQDKNTLKKYR